MSIPKATYLWIPVVGNIVAVVLIPFVGRWSDKVGRRPLIITGALSSGALSQAWSARETYRIHLNDLGMKDAQPVPRDEYERIRVSA